MLARALREVGIDARECASQGGLFGNPMLADAPWRAIRLSVAPELRSVAQKRGAGAIVAPVEVRELGTADGSLGTDAAS